MAVFNGKFTYKGDVSELRCDELSLEFHFPQFVYELTVENKTVRRIEKRKKSITLPYPLSEGGKGEYQAGYPTGLIVSEDLDLFRTWVRTRLRPHFVSEKAQLKIPYSVVVPSGTAICSGEFKALFAFAPSTKPSDTSRPTDFDFPGQELQADKLFLVNAEMCNRFLPRFRQLLRSSSTPVKHLLMLMGEIANCSESSVRPVQLSEGDLQLLISRWHENGVKLTPDVVKSVYREFEKLTSFPIEVAKVGLVKPAGSLRIAGEENVPRSDLTYYRLKVEATVRSRKGMTRHHAWDVNWKDLESDPIAQPLPFATTSEDPIFSTSIEGAVNVRVTGFDGRTLWSNSYPPDSEKLNAIEIVVNANRPGVLEGGGISASDESRRIRGQVLTTEESQSVRGLTVVLQAKQADDKMWQIVSAGETGSSGHFSLPYPKGSYVAAQALVSIAPDSVVDVGIEETDNPEETISDSFIYLLIDAENLSDESSCSCDSGASRLPDHADLIESGEYSQDLGGQCVNVTSPNRRLREYSYNAIVRVSDPDVANYTLEKTPHGFELTGGHRKIERAIIDLSNPIRWQDAPGAGDRLNFYQSVTVATGHILFFRSVFKADGYSLGDLIYSLPLAPGQKKQIVTYDVANTLEASEAQRLAQGERLAAELIDDRVITDELSGGISEYLSGESSSSTEGFSAGLGLGVSVGNLGGSLGVAGGYSNAESSASQSGARDISQFFAEKLRQALMQNAESYRELNASVVTTVKEGQEYAVTTEVIANHNHCHSMTMMFFEVLRHYAITQELTDVQECVFVPLLLTDFTNENISKWKDVLAKNLLPIPSNTYIQPPWFKKYVKLHPLIKAFDANERIKTDYTRVSFPEGTYAEDDVTTISGEMRLRIKLPRPRTAFDRILSLPMVSSTVQAGIDHERSLLSHAPGGDRPGIYYKTEEVHERSDISNQFLQLDSNYQTVPPARAIRVLTFSEKEVDGEIIDGFDNIREDRDQWQIYADIIGGFSDVYEMMNQYFAGRLVCEWDRIFNEDILPLVFNKIVESLKIEPLNLDFTALGGYKGGERSIRFRIATDGSHGSRVSLGEEMRMYSNNGLIRELAKLPNMKLMLENLRLQYATAHFNGYIFNGFVGNDLLDGDEDSGGAWLRTPLTARDQRNPKQEDEYLVAELLEHLNSNLEHYNKVLWRNLDEDRRYMLLDGFNIEIYDRAGTSLGYRSLASVIKNDLITIVGNSLVFPVASGYNVSQTHVVIGDSEQAPSLLDHYRPSKTVEPYRLSVPTRGVYMESVMGQCDSCEEVKENSSQDWDEFRTEEPTAITPVVTPTPARTDWRAIWASFAQPLIAMQSPREAPAPGEGLKGLTEALTDANAFRDVTGLTGTQENAIRTYLSNQENARAFAEMAKTMAMQEHNSENSRSIMNSLDSARDSGALSDSDYNDLVRDHLGQQIDGGSRRAAEERREINRDPSLTNAAIDAVEDGREVSAERRDRDGTIESLQVGATDLNESIDPIHYNVELVSQPTALSCWAAAMAMIENYRRNRYAPNEPELDATEFAAGAELVLDESYSWHDLQAARDEYGFQVVPDLDGEVYPDPEKWRDWLRNYGPLYITVSSDPTSHAIVIHGVSGNLTPSGCMLEILDPSPVGHGTPSRSISVEELNSMFNGGDLSDLEVYNDWRVLFHPENSWSAVQPTGNRGRLIFRDPPGQDLNFTLPSVIFARDQGKFFDNVREMLCWIMVCRSDGGRRLDSLLEDTSRCNLQYIHELLLAANTVGSRELRLRVRRNRDAGDRIERLHFTVQEPDPERQLRLIPYTTVVVSVVATEPTLNAAIHEFTAMENSEEFQRHGIVPVPGFNRQLPEEQQSVLGRCIDRLGRELGFAAQGRPLSRVGMHFYRTIAGLIQSRLILDMLDTDRDVAFDVEFDVRVYPDTNPMYCVATDVRATRTLPDIPPPPDTELDEWRNRLRRELLNPWNLIPDEIRAPIEVVQTILDFHEVPERECFAQGYFDNIGFHPPQDRRDTIYASGISNQIARARYIAGWQLADRERLDEFEALWNEQIVPALRARGLNQAAIDFYDANDDERYSLIGRMLRSQYRSIQQRVDYVDGP